MKIILIAPEAYYLPVGMAFISAALKRAGHEVDVCYHGRHLDFLVKPGKRYDFIGTGGMSSQLAVMRQIRQIAVGYGAKFICGGPIISADPLVMAEMVGVDYGVVGEGEETVVELFDCLDRGDEPRGIAGLVYRVDGKYIQTGARTTFLDIDTLPRPDLESFGYAERLEMARPTDVYYLDIFDYPREYPLITSRSCPYSCTFCYQPENRRYRVRDIDDVINEIRDVIHKHRINIISVYDELFHAKDERLIEFCEKFKALRETIPWDVRFLCQARVTHMTDALLEKLADAGCFMISYGIESYSRHILESMRKKITPEQIDKTVSATLAHGISVQGNFLFGDPKETIETAQETLDYWRTHLDFGIVLYWIIPIPGSAVHRYALKKGLLGELEDFLLHRYFKPINFTGMSNRDFYEVGRRVFQHKMLCCDWQTPIKVTRTSVKIKCPHCHSEMHYKNYPNKTYRFQAMLYCRNCRRRFYGAAPLYKLYAQIIGRMVFNPWVYKRYVEFYEFLRRGKRFGQNLLRKMRHSFSGQSTGMDVHTMREESRIGKNV